MVKPCDVLAVGAHPDDVELGCGATLARLAAAGRTVGVLDLSAGELATRGTAEQRAREAAGAASTLGVAWRACLGLPDGALDPGDGEQAGVLVRALRTARPRAVLLPHRDDPHPDHPAAAALVRRAAFLAGVARCLPAAGAAHRPSLLLEYPGPRQLFAPLLVIDVSAHYDAKRRALVAYGSQFDAAKGPPTHLASGHYLAAIEGRDRACGNGIGCELGEGFSSPGPLPAGEIAWLLGG
jgi:bacillithiol biosynthesis deacetylase BshB1